MMNSKSFFKQHILSSDQFSKESLKLIIDTARKIRPIIEKQGVTDILKGKIMTALFYEPSSRTFASFIAAIQRLGGGFIPLQGITYSSVIKGESLEDTVSTFASYSDIIVIRHPEVGAAKKASLVSPVPIINAGDGIGEHPTQALLDYFTIVEKFKKIDGLTFTMVGDLLNGRTVHSLIKLLSLYKSVKINLVSPEILQLPDLIMKKIKERNIEIFETEKLDYVIDKSDVVYVTRVQKERFSNLKLYEKLKNYYIITPAVLKKVRKSAIIMHPLPRTGEISTEVDSDGRAVYLREQIKNGMYLRMALLKLILIRGQELVING